MKHEIIEKRAGLLGILIAAVISVGGLVEIVPLYFSSQVTTPAPGVKPYGPLELEGRDIYIREGCYGCHSQMTARWYRDWFDPFVEAARRYPFFIAWNPLRFPDEVLYGWCNEDIQPTNQGRRDFMSVGFSVEAIG